MRFYGQNILILVAIPAYLFNCLREFSNKIDFFIKIFSFLFFVKKQKNSVWKFLYFRWMISVKMSVLSPSIPLSPIPEGRDGSPRPTHSTLREGGGPNGKEEEKYVRKSGFLKGACLFGAKIVLIRIADISQTVIMRKRKKLPLRRSLLRCSYSFLSI